MGKICAASFCRKLIDETVKCYQFPPKSDKNRLRIWQKRLLAEADALIQYACSRHFSDDQFCYKGTKLDLRSSAVPDMNYIRRTVLPKDPLDAACRLCLEQSKNDYQLIFPVWPNPDVPSAEDIAELFGIEILPNDDLPRLICVTCSTKIKYFKRIRSQFLKNDTIIRKKFTTKKNAPVTENVSNRSDITPKITAVASLGKNPVNVSSASTESEEIPRKAYGSVVYLQEGDTYQRFQIINSNQIAIVGDHEETVTVGEYEEIVSTSVKIEPPDTGCDIVEIEDTKILFTEDANLQPENAQVKLEFQQSDFGSLQADDSQPEELEGTPEKRLRIDKPFRYANRTRIKKQWYTG